MITVRQFSNDPNRWYFDFDLVAPGGRGGASVLLDYTHAMASIDAVHKNSLVPPRSTGALIADGLKQAGMSKPVIVEAYNVERTTCNALALGGDGRGTPIGNLLEDIVSSLWGTVTRWEPIPFGTAFHLRVHAVYP